MRAFNIKRNILLWAISIVMVIGLTGCFKGNISVDVQWDGSAIVSVALGMTQEAQSLISSQGQNPFQDMQQTLTDKSGNIPKGTEVKKWREGDYDWMSATGKFNNLEQVNQLMADKTLFNHFSLTRKRGIFRDEFILNAELSALGSDMPSSDIGLDPTAFMSLSFTTRLPGNIVESNGFSDLNDPNLFTWNAQGRNTVPVNARSLSWNWINISVIMVVLFGLFIFGIYAFGGFDFLLNPPKRTPYNAPQSRSAPLSNQSTLQSPLPSAIHKTNYIVELGIEDLLNQVNTRMLNSKGEIRKQPMEMALIWKDLQGVQKFIYIKDLGNHQITVNGMNFPATRDNAKAGIMQVLHKINQGPTAGNKPTA